MNTDDFNEVYCPFCGEPTQIHIGTVGTAEAFVEDCTVCCRPILVHVNWDEEGRAELSAERESD